MPKVIEWYQKLEKWLKTDFSISNRLRLERKGQVLGAQSELKSRERFTSLLATDNRRVRVLKIAHLLYQPLLKSQGLFNIRLRPGI